MLQSRCKPAGSKFEKSGGARFWVLGARARGYAGTTVVRACYRLALFHRPGLAHFFEFVSFHFPNLVGVVQPP